MKTNQDIILGTSVSGTTPQPGILKLKSNGNVLGFMTEASNVTSGIAIADLDGLGKKELCYGTTNKSITAPTPDTFLCRNADLSLFQPTTINHVKTQSWPTLEGDAQRISAKSRK
jgi:hypothetical protein